MTTFAALRTQCATRFRDAANAVITDVVWKDYVNQAYQEANAFSNLWPWLETSEQTVTVNAGSRSAALPTDVLQVNWVYDTTNNQYLRPMEGRGEQWTSSLRTDTGLSAAYRLRASTIELFPTPVGSTVLAVEAVLMPVRMSADGDLPVFPANWHELLIPGALALAFLDDGNSEFHKNHDDRFRRQLQEMLNAITAFRTSSYVAVRDNFWG